MYSFISRRTAGSAVLMAAALLVAACGSLKPVPPEKTVSKLALDYWAARKAGQIDKVYAMSTPSYRKLRTEAQFRQKLGTAASFETAEVFAVNCESEKCNVRMKLGVKPNLPRLNIGIIDTYLDEIWLLEDGQWWHHQEP